MELGSSSNEQIPGIFTYLSNNTNQHRNSPNKYFLNDLYSIFTIVNSNNIYSENTISIICDCVLF